MWHGNPKVNWNRKIYLTKSKQRIKKQENLARNKKQVLGCYIISTLLYGSKCKIISSQMKKWLKATERCFSKRMLWMPWKIRIKRTLILEIRKTQLKCLRHIMRKEDLDNLTLTWHSEGKRAERNSQ